MKRLGNTNRHYWLAQRMAKATGADLVGAYKAGHLSQEEWAQMVQDCRNCEWTEGCVRWLQQNGTAEQVPSACANCGRFADLQSDLTKRF